MHEKVILQRCIEFLLIREIEFELFGKYNLLTYWKFNILIFVFRISRFPCDWTIDKSVSPNTYINL